ncbi:MAG: hypothetical protein IKX14_03765 [Neisseriaceae bacterium]|nr:hypothetical protein [Neisseriaceae bacterium]
MFIIIFSLIYPPIRLSGLFKAVCGFQAALKNPFRLCLNRLETPPLKVFRVSSLT